MGSFSIAPGVYVKINYYLNISDDLFPRELRLVKTLLYADICLKAILLSVDELDGS